MNTTILKKLINIYYDAPVYETSPSISMEDLLEIGLSPKQLPCTIGNFYLRKTIFGKVKMEVIDLQQDLTGTWFDENEELVLFLESQWKKLQKHLPDIPEAKRELEIQRSVFEEFFFPTKHLDIRINNFFLTAPPAFESTRIKLPYTLRLYDKRLDYQSRLLNEYVTTQIVRQALIFYTPSAQIEAEKDLQKDVIAYLRQKFVTVHNTYGISGAKATEIDIHVGNDSNGVGIELKLAKKIAEGTEAVKDRALGQVVKYTKSLYSKGNFIMFLYGKLKYENNAAVEQIRSFVENDTRAVFVYSSEEMDVQKQIEAQRNLFDNEDTNS